jgi:hypothetical protein
VAEAPKRPEQPTIAGAVALAAGAAAALFALQRLPFGYYSVTRIVVFLGAGYGAWWLWERKRVLPALVAAAVALLFNPLLPVRMHRAEWQQIDVLAGVVLLGLAVYTFLTRAR